MSLSNFNLKSKVLLHPLVLFQIIDAYERRPKDDTEVMGTLMGTIAGKTGRIEISNCFSVLHRMHGANSSHIDLDLKYDNDMLVQHRQDHLYRSGGAARILRPPVPQRTAAASADGYVAARRAHEYAPLLCRADGRARRHQGPDVHAAADGDLLRLGGDCGHAPHAKALHASR
ncbi:uncharacterized protein LOC111078657 isoform X2 [Drosophila obscura]|uniref:uncharacterized protein LOC111078657 isoform X2 n=1 Tax=Drosophila obscura TaxID=7282 RepID=UPI001BB0E7A7|nr:uncharacterized protein LOC111078657 isoform X2 [Drosophila obscura]